jgi:3-methyladenine DNA glycosylase AlkD
MSMSVSPYHAEVFARLQPLGEPERAPLVKNYMKSQLDFLAIKVPVMRAALREPFSFSSRSPNEVLDIWSEIWFSSPYFEVMSAALTSYSRKHAKIAPDLWPTLARWSSRIENWAHSDELSSIYSYLLAQQPDVVYPQLKAWNASNEQWLRRLSLVSLIHFSGKNAIFLPQEQMMPLVMACMDDKRYYVQKAVGWVLREMADAYPGKVHAYIETNKARMSGVAFSVATEHFSTEERQKLLAWRKAHRRQAGKDA